MTTTTIIILGMIVMAVIFSEYESKNHKKMSKKRPCRFQIRKPWNSEAIWNKEIKTDNEQKKVVIHGLFHRFGDKIEYTKRHEPVGHTFAIVEDEHGIIHHIDPNQIQFLDK